MKKLLLLVLITATISSLFSQQQDMKKVYDRKVRQYMVVKDYALAGALLGATLTATGIALSVQGSEIASHQQYYNGNYTSTYQDNIYSELAPVFTAAGVYILGAGVVMSIVSYKKLIKYKNLRDRVTLNFNISPAVQGVVFSYRF